MRGSIDDGKSKLRKKLESSPRPHVGILQQREIEARVIAPIYLELVERLGEEEAKQIISAAVLADAEAAGRDFRRGAQPGQEMRHFIDIQEYWEADDALNTEHVLETDDRYSYTVHHCGYAEMYQRLGIPDLGAILSCGRDFAFAQGYDPNLELSRSQTIMQGAPCCPFQYVLRRGAGKGEDDSESEID